MSNGLRVPQLPLNGIPPGPMQGMQGQMPMPTVGLVTQAAQTAESQRALIQMQQQQAKVSGQSPPMHNSPPRTNGLAQPHGFPMPQNMMAFNANANGISTPPMNGMASSGQHGQSGSPRMGQPQYSQDHQPNTMINQMEAQLRKQYPNLPNDRIMAMMTDHLKRQAQQRQGLAQSAMNAAAGGMSDQSPRMTAANVTNGPQQYAQMLLQQQQNQQKQEQARQAASALTENRNLNQGHAHRNSSGSVQSGK